MSEWNRHRDRGKTLLIVEGFHEKEELFYNLFRCYPELGIDQEHIKVYGTNIYALHNAILKEYGTEWRSLDVDLAYLTSDTSKRVYKNDFINILLIFDYERHDPNFSKTVITDLLSCFNDATTMGKLYINYPMVESYEHINSFPDLSYENLTIPASICHGSQYKELVKGTLVTKIMNFPKKLRHTLRNSYNLSEEAIASCADQLLNLESITGLEEEIRKIMAPKLNMIELATATHHLPRLLSGVGHLNDQHSFWIFLRTVFSKIIIHNICKASKIQNGDYVIEQEMLEEYFRALREDIILEKQNEVSKDAVSGFIWVINTCIFFVAEYKIELICNEI